MGFYKNGPKLMIGGDPHAHRPDQVERLTKEYNCVDYVLTGAVFSRKLKDKYLYPADELWNKHVYFPHMVPDTLPSGLTNWTARADRVLLSGDLSEAVYPYRYACAQLAKTAHSPLEVLGRNDFHHTKYFEKLAQYKAATTCTSIFRYMVAKYLEIPWVGTVLMAPRPITDECVLMGFEDCVNVIWCEMPEEVPLHFKKMLPLLEEVGEAGSKLMREHHTTTRRLDYIVHLVDRINKGGFVPEDAKQLFLDLRKGAVHALP